MKRIGVVLALAFSACSSGSDVIGDPGNGTGGGGAGGDGKGGTNDGTPIGPKPDFMIPTGGSGNSNGGASNGMGDPMGGGKCGQQNFMLQTQPAEIVLVLDRSSSMRERFGDGNTKWAAVVPVLDSTLMKTSGLLHWGLKTFPEGTENCLTTDAIAVPVAPGNYNAVSGAISMSGPDGHGTPLAPAVVKTTAYLKSLTSPNPKVMLVATDGLPNCPDRSGPADSVAAVKAAADANIRTFVIGVSLAGDQKAVQTLDMIAAAGNGAPKHFPVNNPAELEAALATITGQVASCSFPLDKAPPSPNDVSFRINNKQIARDTSRATGWDYGPNFRSIQVFGKTCDDLKASKGDVKVIFGCPGVPIQ